MAPVLVPLRPSSEHILIVRAPGVRNQHGCHSIPFIVGALRARRAPGHSPLHSKLRSLSPQGWRLIDLPLRASNEHSFIVHVLRARRMVWRLPSHPSEAACCASTEHLPAPSSPLFREQEDGQAAPPPYLSYCPSTPTAQVFMKGIVQSHLLG